MSRGFLLDTNIPSEQTKPRPDPRLGFWLYYQPAESLFLSAITIGEPHQGIVLSPNIKRRGALDQWFEAILLPMFVGRILPLDFTGLGLTILNPWEI